MDSAATGLLAMGPGLPRPWTVGALSGSVWIRTLPDLDGVYRCVVEIDDDISHPINRDTAPTYTRAILQAVSRAEYDAAVIRQLGPKTNQQAAAQLVAGMRGERPPIAWPSPLQLEPGVSAFTGDAFLHVRVGSRTVGQWTIPDAREHATAVMEAVEVADLDGGYLRALRSIDVDEPRARTVVDDLANHRQATQR